jgi:hypothetical protein
MKLFRKSSKIIFGKRLALDSKMLTKIVALFALGYFATPALATCDPGEL